MIKINGKYDEYFCESSSYGWSFAIVVIRKKKKLIFGIFEIYLRVTVKIFGGSKAFLDAERLNPREMVEWFQKAVDEYEKYCDEWNDFNEENK